MCIKLFGAGIGSEAFALDFLTGSTLRLEGRMGPQGEVERSSWVLYTQRQTNQPRGHAAGERAHPHNQRLVDG